MGDGADSIDPEEFDGWIKPADVWAAYALDRYLGFAQLSRLLVAEKIGTACASFETHYNKMEYVRLPPGLWREMPIQLSDFWTYGSLERVVEVDGKGDCIATLFDVRFQPPVSQPGPDDARKRLPNAEAERISKVILEIYGIALTEDRAWQLAKGMCPDNSVSRDPFLKIFRVIRGDKNRGKQPLRGE